MNVTLSNKDGSTVVRLLLVKSLSMITFQVIDNELLRNLPYVYGRPVSKQRTVDCCKLVD